MCSSIGAIDVDTRTLHIGSQWNDLVYSCAYVCTYIEMGSSAAPWGRMGPLPQGPHVCICGISLYNCTYYKKTSPLHAHYITKQLAWARALMPSHTKSCLGVQPLFIFSMISDMFLNTSPISSCPCSVFIRTHRFSYEIKKHRRNAVMNL